MSNKRTPPRGCCNSATLARIGWLRQRHAIDYQANPLPQPTEDYRGLAENIVGGMTLPVSIAAPLRISKGDKLKGEFAVPLVTLEGTLVLSMMRGMYITALSGGIETMHCGQTISRAPAFRFADLHDALHFAAWIKDRLPLLQQAAAQTTRFGKLIGATPHLIHNTVIVDLAYDTCDAAGQNMITIATQKVLDTLLAQHDCPKPMRHYIESNFSGDKNGAWRNMTLGRGHKVIARACIDEKILRRTARVSIDDMTQAYYVKQDASLLAGVSGFNMHAVNALTAIYLATGQDAACAAENANSIVRYERQGNALTVSATLPSLTVGTVGGATRLPQQRRHLEMIGCTGEHATRKLAQIIGACVLSLELSLGAAITSHEFAEAHRQYGRR